MRDLGICFLISLFFELLQLFTMIGNFATMDLITNVAGYFVGLVFYELIFKKQGNQKAYAKITHDVSFFKHHIKQYAERCKNKTVCDNVKYFLLVIKMKLKWDKIVCKSLIQCLL